MKRIFSWVVSHKLASILLLILLWTLFRNSFSSSSSIFPTSRTQTSDYSMKSAVGGGPNMVGLSNESISYPLDQAAPAPDVTNRMVVQNSYISLLVKNVSETINLIKQRVTSVSGYMVETDISNPDEAANGTITLRIPQEKLDESLAYFRTLAVKVVSENLQGTDVTDQFVDNEERLRILEKNKARMEEIMSKAAEISDIVSIQREVFNIQSQIDSIKGQQNYLEKTTAMSKVTLYLSTDELALPYAPNNSWRPALVFKLAVRSLLSSLQGLGTILIWVAVYATIIIPLIIVIYLLTRFVKRTSKI